jgi:hypothetical protein
LRQRRFPQHTGGISVDDPAIDSVAVFHFIFNEDTQ